MGIRPCPTLALTTRKRVGQGSKYYPLGPGQGALHLLLDLILRTCFISGKSDMVSEKHAIHLHIPEIALCLVNSSSKYCLKAQGTNQRAMLCRSAILLFWTCSSWTLGATASSELEGRSTWTAVCWEEYSEGWEVEGGSYLMFGACSVYSQHCALLSMLCLYRFF